MGEKTQVYMTIFQKAIRSKTNKQLLILYREARKGYGEMRDKIFDWCEAKSDLWAEQVYRCIDEAITAEMARRWAKEKKK